MDPTPRLNYKGFSGKLTNDSCGIKAMENHSLAFWQSRMSRNGARAEVPAMTNLSELAVQVRQGWPR